MTVSEACKWPVNEGSLIQIWLRWPANVAWLPNIRNQKIPKVQICGNVSSGCIKRKIQLQQAITMFLTTTNVIFLYEKKNGFASHLEFSIVGRGTLWFPASFSQFLYFYLPLMYTWQDRIEHDLFCHFNILYKYVCI